jgi:hypothetical protein
MKDFNTILVSFLIVLSMALTIVQVHHVENEINHLKQSQERFDSLIKDSIKMHSIYENWELNYYELKRLEK